MVYSLIKISHEIRGWGLDIEQPNEDFLLKVTSQKQAFLGKNDTDEKYELKKSHRKEANVGKYVVNVNLLNKGILSTRKPSGAHVP